MASALATSISCLVVCYLFAAVEGSSLKYTNSNHTDKEVGLTCNNNYCPTYCCYDSWDNWICCDSNDITDMWWFWFSFAIGLFVFVLCLGFCCRYRNRTERRRYLIITGERPAVVTSYGTEYVAPIMAAPPAYGTTAYMAPPVYTGAQLPGYTPTAEAKGNPPKYTTAS